ncbi:MAG: O-antigen ligase family protein [Gemmatimonadaceae bacterium]
MTAPAIKRRSLQPSGAAVQRAGAIAAAKLGFDSNPFLGIEFTPAFAAFCAYTLAIISYRFQIGTASMSAALLTISLEKRSLRLPAVAALSLALVAWAYLGVLTTSYPDTVLADVTEFAKICAVIFVAANVINTRARFRAFAVGSIILWGMFPIRGTMFNYFIYHGDVQGRAAWNYIYANPNDLAGLCLLQLSMALGMLAVEKRGWVRLGMKFAVAQLLLIIILTQSRGAVIALVAFGLIGGRKYFRNMRAIVSLLVLAGLVYLIAPDSVWRRFSTIKNAGKNDVALLDPETVDLATRQDQGSSEQRLAIWEVAVAIIEKNPLTGVGLGAYPEAHNVMSARPEFNPSARGPRDTHSTYLNVMAETGVPGFLLFMAIMVITLKNARAARKRLGAAAPALALQLFNMEVGLYAFLVAAIWGSYGKLIPLYMHLVLIHVATQLLIEHAEGIQPQRGRGRYVPPAATAKIGRIVEASA